jgi:AcrR family transcriptional regulator
MPRPSRNLDRALLAAGRALFPHRGCAGLSVREVADAADVNLGMFHYHFKSREAFLRAVMQHTYEEMFATLTFSLQAMGGGEDAVRSLRLALRVIARFVRDNRAFLGRVLADALSGEACARDFLRDNLPRHLGVLNVLVARGQQEGRLAQIPVPQAVATCAGALAMPILFGGAALDMNALAPPLAKVVEASLVSDAGIDERIELVIRAISSDPASKPMPKPTRKQRGKP